MHGCIRVCTLVTYVASRINKVGTTTLYDAHNSFFFPLLAAAAAAATGGQFGMMLY